MLGICESKKIICGCIIKKVIKSGLEKIVNEKSNLLEGAKVGLICNQASVNGNFAHAADLFFENKKINLVRLFGPQHGIRGDVQDNMIETEHAFDQKTELQIFSLYSETREPTKEMIADLDILVFDLQDVGCRIYTFIYTMALAMKVCAEYGKKFIVCDRPNPINGVDVEGNLLEEGEESFVGMYPITIRHGLTVGELAKLFNREFNINCDLEIVTMDGWNRPHYFEQTGAAWVMTSPNIPTVDTAVVFPATVIFEGTEISEGRGTTRPFEMVGAPFINAENLAENLNSFAIPGIKFRAVNFIPTFQKHSGQVCGGVFLHITDRQTFQPVRTGMRILQTIMEMYPYKFEWKKTPYEYEFERNPFDVIVGTKKIRNLITEGKFNEILDIFSEDEEKFKSLREDYLMY